MDILKLRGIFLFACALVNLFLALIIWQKGSKNKINLWTSIWVFFSALYAFSAGGTYFFWKPDSISSVFWYRSTWLGVLMLPPFVISTYYFAGKIKTLKLKAFFLYLSAAVISYLALATFLFVESVYLKHPNISSSSGILDPIGRLYILICLAIGLFILFKEYLRTSGYKKLQVKYFILGVGIYASGGIIATGIVPLLIGESTYYDIPVYLSLIWAALTTYAITRYRLMDIRVVMGKTAIYVFSFLSVIGLAFLLMFLNNQLAQPVSFNIFFPLTIVAAVLFFKLFFWLFEKLASKYFYYTFYSYQTVLTDLGERLTRVLELGKLSALIASTLIRTMKLDRTVILLRDPETGDYQIQKNIGFKEENGISLVKDNFLTRYLGKTQKPLVYEELALIIRDSKDEKEKRSLENLKENMKRIEAALCLPLFREKKIIGMIVLGNKISGDPYSQQDIELLTTLTSQASIALENARFYNQVQDLSQNLQEKVNEQTRELREAYEELKKLDKAKSEFVSIASHQLRTPLAAIKGYISMILEGDYGKLPERAEKSMENVYHSNERLIKLVNGLLNISRIETGRIEIKKEKTAIGPLIESLIEELKPQVKEKNIYLKFEKPKTKIPQILADRDKLRQVLLNILDNGIRYTSKGGVTIELQIVNGKLQIVVSDTGEGMTKDELSKIFQTFSRGKAGAKFWVEGVGLGLYIAKRFMELQGGKIWAESPGKEKGSVFYIELPIE